MNERIDEIAYLSGCYKTSRSDPVRPEGNGWIINHETLDKFAAAIVQECLDVIQKEVSMKYCDGSDTEDLEFVAGHYAGSLLARAKIRNHFANVDD